ncbi:MAG: hypothetical protein ABL989_11635 [Gammaproteobacteria bacterium]
MTDQAKKTPAFRIFQISPRGDNSRAYWREIGVAWANSDGSYNLRLESVPTDWSNTLQLRAYDEAANGDRVEKDRARGK